MAEVLGGLLGDAIKEFFWGGFRGSLLADVFEGGSGKKFCLFLKVVLGGGFWGAVLGGGDSTQI